MAQMRTQLAEWHVTMSGTNKEARLVKARKEQRCDGSAHYLSSGRIEHCDRLIERGQVYVKVRTGAWPILDDPMHIECAEAAGFVERQS